MLPAYRWYVAGLYLAFGINHAVDVFVFHHHDPQVDPAVFYRTLLGIAVPIAMVSGLVFLLGLRIFSAPRPRQGMRLQRASALSGVVVSALMFSVAHLTERLWGAESTLAHTVSVGALLLLSAGTGAVTAGLGGRRERA